MLYIVGGVKSQNPDNGKEKLSQKEFKQLQAEKKNEIKLLEDSIIQLRKEIDELCVQVNESPLYKKFEKLETPYSTISFSFLDSLHTQIMAYQKDGNIMDLLKKINSAKDYKRLIDKVDTLLQRPLDIKALTDVKERINGLDTVMNKVQYEEFEIRKHKLSVYPEAVIKFKELISILNDNSDVKAYRSLMHKEFSYERILEILDDNKKDYYDSFISSVPYLAEVFKKYKIALEKDPLKFMEESEVVKIENMIEGMKTEE